MALVSSNVSLEGSRSQKRYNNVRTMLSMVYFHCKTMRKAAAKSVILVKFKKSPAKSRRDWTTHELQMLTTHTKKRATNTHNTTKQRNANKILYLVVL